MKLLSDLGLVKPVDMCSDTGGLLLEKVGQFLEGGGVFSWAEWVALGPEEKAIVVRSAREFRSGCRRALASALVDILEERLGGHIEEAKENQGLDTMALAILKRGVGG